MKQKGFTLIELMVVIAVVIIIALTVLGFTGAPTSTISFGINGLTEVRCIEGYKFVVGENGQARQILDEFGKGARCN